eukprot:10651118-Alexandrium_andersonii.AAC.1
MHCSGFGAGVPFLERVAFGGCNPVVLSDHGWGFGFCEQTACRPHCCPLAPDSPARVGAVHPVHCAHPASRCSSGDEQRAVREPS